MQYLLIPFQIIVAIFSPLLLTFSLLFAMLIQADRNPSAAISVAANAQLTGETVEKGMMMSMYDTHDDPSSRKIIEQQKTIGLQLLRTITTMRQVDELFHWLAHTIVQYLDVQFIQFWTNQVNQRNQIAVQLRAMVSQDPSVPQQIVVNDHVASIAQRVVSERLMYAPQPVEALFSQYQAILLKRYGLYFCIGCFTASDSLLPHNSYPAQDAGYPVPLAMATLLLLRKIPHRDFVPVISTLLEQAVVAAGNRGLLLPPSRASLGHLPLNQMTSRQESLTPLGQLIPYRKQEDAYMLSDNPFKGPSVIANKPARSLYNAIDGRINVTGLGETTGMNLKELYAALQVLLEQRRIGFHEPGGREVDTSLYFDRR